MKLPKDTLKQILVGSGFVKESDFEEAAQSAEDLEKSVEDILIFRGLITPDAFSQLIAEYLHVPYVNIGHLPIPEEVLSLVPEKLSRNYRTVPFAMENGQLKVAMSNPTDFEALETLKRHTNMQIIPHYSGEEEISRAMGKYKSNIRDDFEKEIQENLQQAHLQGEDILKAAEKLPVIKILDTILEYSVAERASDVHIETQSDHVIIRFRIDGDLVDIMKLPRGIEEALIARVKILSNLKLDEHRIPQDGRHKFKVDEDTISLRISIIPGFYGENVVMRLLRESARPLSLEELGMQGKNFEIIKKNIEKPHGMILVTGPTGSGKTTTLYSILNILNTVQVKICTIEDPIEYGMKRITQIQVNPKAGLTFASGLRSLLRHDPDIMMVGEIRDAETAEIAVHAALTGHLVLSTLHTNSAAGAIPRLIDMGVEPFLASSTINAVIAQRLVKKIDQEKLEKYNPDEKFLNNLRTKYNINPKDMQFYRPDQKSGGGFSGRIGIYEVLEMTDTIRELVNKKASSDQIEDAAKREGMVIMMEDGLNKVSAGQTTIEQVLEAVFEE